MPDADGEPVRAEKIVPDAKAYISETIDDPAQYLTKEQQKACLDSAAAELVHEITYGGSLN